MSLQRPENRPLTDLDLDPTPSNSQSGSKASSTLSTASSSDQQVTATLSPRKTLSPLPPADTSSQSLARPVYPIYSSSIFGPNRRSNNKSKQAQLLSELQQKDRAWRAEHDTETSRYLQSHQPSSSLSSSFSGAASGIKLQDYKALCLRAAQQNASQSNRPLTKRPNTTPSVASYNRPKQFESVLNKAALSKRTHQPFDLESLALEKLSLQREREAAKAKDRLVRRRQFPQELPEDLVKRVKQLFKQRGTISQIPGGSVADKDMVKLKPGQWLNDEVINFYMVLINRRSNELEKAREAGQVQTFKKGQEPLNVFAFTSFFYSKFKREGYKSVTRWTKKTDVFKKDAVLMPINLNNTHWVCACINIRKKRFEFYDSMGSWNQDIIDVSLAGRF